MRLPKLGNILRTGETPLERTAKHWAEQVSSDQVFWKGHPVIRRYMWRRLTGNPNKPDLQDLFERHFPGGVECGLSLACGHGSLERQMLRRGWARTMHGFDLSAGAVENARKLAAEDGMDDRVEYWVGNFNEPDLPDARYDAVFSYSASHHCAALERMFDAVRRTLKPDGLFVINEYMGPSQFQFPQSQIDVINEILAILPAKYRLSINESKPDKPVYKERFHPIDTRDLEARDPSEAIRSGEIRSVFGDYFERVDYRPYGGNLFQFLMSGIVGNFDPDDESDTSLIEMIGMMEEKLEATGAFESDCALLVGRPLA